MPMLDELESWFSSDRLGAYRMACGGDPHRAVATYEWNAYISGALWSTLGHVEVLLRNALHRQLGEWSRHRYGDDRWYLTISELINQQTSEDIANARRRAIRDGRVETSGRVVANLTSGSGDTCLLVATMERSGDFLSIVPSPVNGDLKLNGSFPAYTYYATVLVIMNQYMAGLCKIFGAKPCNLPDGSIPRLGTGSDRLILQKSCLLGDLSSQSLRAYIGGVIQDQWGKL
ncbi:MAG: hypothetical protein ACREN8_11295 [Candidatus Dormibacteraceae bacterium]